MTRLREGKGVGGPSKTALPILPMLDHTENNQL